MMVVGTKSVMCDYFTELNIAFLPKDLINNYREELIEYAKHNESGVKIISLHMALV